MLTGRRMEFREFLEITLKDAHFFVPFGMMAAIVMLFSHYLGVAQLINLSPKWSLGLITDHVPLASLVVLFTTALLATLTAAVLREGRIARYLVALVHRLVEKMYAFISVAVCLLGGFSLVVAVHAVAMREASSWATFALIVLVILMLVAMPALMGRFINDATAEKALEKRAFFGVALCATLVVLAFYIHTSAQTRQIVLKVEADFYQNLEQEAWHRGMALNEYVVSMLDARAEQGEDPNLMLQLTR